MTKNMMGLAPGVTTTSSAATGMPRVSSMCSAIASRSSGRPGRGPVVGRARRRAPAWPRRGCGPACRSPARRSRGGRRSCPGARARAPAPAPRRRSPSPAVPSDSAIIDSIMLVLPSVRTRRTSRTPRAAPSPADGVADPVLGREQPLALEEHGHREGLRHHRDPVEVAHHHVARRDPDPADRHRPAPLDGAPARQGVQRGPVPAEDGEPLAQDVGASRVAPSITTPRTPRAFMATADSSRSGPTPRRWTGRPGPHHGARPRAASGTPGSRARGRACGCAGRSRGTRPRRPGCRAEPTMSWGSVWSFRPGGRARR